MNSPAFAADDPIRVAIRAGMTRWHASIGRSVEDVLMEVFEEHGIIVADAPKERRTAVIVDAIEKYRPEDQSDYIVLPRSVLSSMPHTWQDRFVDLLVALDREHNPRALADRYVVQAVRSVTISDLSDDERDFYGYEPADDGIHFVDTQGRLLGVDARVEIPVEDPTVTADLGDPDGDTTIDLPDSAPHATTLVPSAAQVAAPAWFTASTGPAPVELSPDEEDAFRELERTLTQHPGRTD